MYVSVVMPKIRTGMTDVEIDPIVREAVAALGFFQPDATPVLIARVARLWGGTPYNFQADGEPLPRARGEKRYAIAQEIWDALSEAGRANVEYACKATWLRIAFNIRRADMPAQLAFARSVGGHFELAARVDVTCAAALAQNGTIVSLKRRWPFGREVKLPALPLPGCDADWCACRWAFIPDND